MPAKSKSQQRFMGMVHAIKKGELDPAKVDDPNRDDDPADVAKKIKPSSAKKFAKTKHKGLPNKVKKQKEMKEMTGSFLTGDNAFYRAKLTEEEKSAIKLKVEQDKDEKDDEKKGDKEESYGKQTTSHGDGYLSADKEGEEKATKDVNGDGKIDAKDLKIQELEKDLRIAQLKKSMEDLDDPLPEVKKSPMKSRPRIKDRGDRYEAVDEDGSCLKEFPYGDKAKATSREARYEAQRYAEKYVKDNSDIKESLQEANESIEEAAPGKGTEKDAYSHDGKTDWKGKNEPGMKNSGGGGGSGAGVAASKEVDDENMIKEKISPKVLKTLKALDADEAKLIIQGLPKAMQKQAMKALGLKETDMPKKKVDGRTKAYKETARRLMAKKEKMNESSKEYAKSLQKIADKAKRDKIAPSDLDKLEKLAALMKSANEEVSEADQYYKGVAKDKKDDREDQFASQTKKSDDDPSAYKPAPGDLDKDGKFKKTKMSKHTKKYHQMYGEEQLVDEDFAINEEEDNSLEGKAKKSGIPLGILKQVYNRGMAAWKTGHRPGASQQQWAHARVNSFITKGSGTWGKADKDLATKAKKAMKESTSADFYADFISKTTLR